MQQVQASEEQQQSQCTLDEFEEPQRLFKGGPQRKRIKRLRVTSLIRVTSDSSRTSSKHWPPEASGMVTRRAIAQVRAVEERRSIQEAGEAGNWLVALGTTLENPFTRVRGSRRCVLDSTGKTLGH